jgi:hypothetical protein
VGLTKGIRKGKREQNLGSWIPRSMSQSGEKKKQKKPFHPARNDKSFPYM